MSHPASHGARLSADMGLHNMILAMLRHGSADGLKRFVCSFDN